MDRSVPRDAPPALAPALTVDAADAADAAVVVSGPGLRLGSLVVSLCERAAGATATADPGCRMCTGIGSPVPTNAPAGTGEAPSSETLAPPPPRPAVTPPSSSSSSVIEVRSIVELLVAFGRDFLHPNQM
jgi:hypothetical protein